jgi:amino acid permease
MTEAQLPAPEPKVEPASKPMETPKSHTKAWIIAIVVIIVALIALGIVLLATADNSTTTRVRDIFIIFMALESLVIGAALVILIVQLSTLINLIQNEIRPILNNTNDTVNNLKGTTAFLSEQMVEPVLKLNAYLAGLKHVLDLLRPK